MILRVILIGLIVLIGFIVSEIYINLGYVDIFLLDYNVKVPLAIAVTSFLAIVLLLVYLYSLTKGLFSSFHKLYLKLFNLDKEAALQNFNKAGLEEIKGNYAKAEKLFVKSAKAMHKPVLNFIRAAYCANVQAKYTERDSHILMACKSDPDSLDLINFNLSKMYFDNQEYAKSNSLLSTVSASNVNKNDFLFLKTQVLEKMQNYTELYNLLPSIKKSNIISGSDLYELQLKLSVDQIKNLNESSNLEYIWKKMPYEIRYDLQVSREYILKLIEFNLTDKVEKFFRKESEIAVLRFNVDLFAKIKQISIVNKIDILNKFLSQEQSSQEFLFWLGYLYFEQQNWQKAKQFFENSVRVSTNPMPMAYAFLARISNVLGDERSKVDNLEKGLGYIENFSK